MAAGALPELDDFFVDGDQGPYSLDRVGLKVSRESVAWSLERLRRDPSLLDYVSLAVPRGFVRPGAVAPGASVSLHATPDGPALLRFDADARGGFEVAVGDAHPLADALAGRTRDRAAGWAGRRRAARPARRGAGRRGDGARARRRRTRRARRQRRCAPRPTAPSSSSATRAAASSSRASASASRSGTAPCATPRPRSGAASEDFLVARVEGNAGLTMTSSGEGGPLRLSSDEDMKWESLQAASGHFGITGADLRRCATSRSRSTRARSPARAAASRAPRSRRRSRRRATSPSAPTR